MGAAQACSARTCPGGPFSRFSWHRSCGLCSPVFSTNRAAGCGPAWEELLGQCGRAEVWDRGCSEEEPRPGMKSNGDQKLPGQNISQAISDRGAEKNCRDAREKTPQTTNLLILAIHTGLISSFSSVIHFLLYFVILWVIPMRSSGYKKLVVKLTLGCAVQCGNRTTGTLLHHHNVPTLYMWVFMQLEKAPGQTSAL